MSSLSNCNIDNTRSVTSLVKYKRVTKSILASKLYAIAYSFDISTVIKAIVKLQLNISLLLIFYTDFKLIYKYFIKLGTI